MEQRSNARRDSGVKSSCDTKMDSNHVRMAANGERNSWETNDKKRDMTAPSNVPKTAPQRKKINQRNRSLNSPLSGASRKTAIFQRAEVRVSLGPVLLIGPSAICQFIPGIARKIAVHCRSRRLF
jgi:hypothetical protein